MLAELFLKKRIMLQCLGQKFMDISKTLTFQKSSLWGEIISSFMNTWQIMLRTSILVIICHFQIILKIQNNDVSTKIITYYQQYYFEELNIRVVASAVMVMYNYSIKYWYLWAHTPIFDNFIYGYDFSSIFSNNFKMYKQHLKTPLMEKN